MNEPIDPYAAPKAELIDSSERPHTPEHKLYPSKAVAIATFFGTPIAAGILLALNYRREGYDDKAWKTVALCVVGTIVLSVLLMAIPAGGVPNTVFIIVQVLIMYSVAKVIQRDMIDLHVDRGGAIESGWKAAGIGFLTGLALTVVAIPIVLLTMDF